MTDTANHLVPEQGKLRRALAVVFTWLQANRVRGPSILTTVAPLGSNIES